ncbi:MAG: hypothetical protein JWM90_1058 [Thermoleophilia bacterium]|nr:hypothetical protein [Thermoleophilia bacterium]
MPKNIPSEPLNVTEPASPRSRWRGLGFRSIITLAALSAFGAVGMLGTQAAFSDDVTMAQITVTGGTLDMVANSETDDTDVAWTGQVAVALTGLAPGDVKTGTVSIDNVGDLPFELTSSTTGTDTSGCFGFYLRETSATGATKAAAWPVDFTGFGTDATGDATTAPFATAVVASSLPDAGADLDWEADDTKVYTIAVRMKSACTTNGAAGTLNVNFNATQA